MSNMTYKEFLTKVGINEDPDLTAVKQDGCALRYVKEQTPDICMAAVKQQGFALKYVKEQTPDICMAAVEQNRDSVRYVDRNIFKPESENG